MRIFPLLFLMIVLLGACHTTQHVDLILHHGKVYTVDSAFRIAEAFAVKEGRIVAVGSNADILDRYESDSTVDAGGAPVYPGLIDAHAHFVGYGRSLHEVGLYGCKSWEEVLQRVDAFAKEHPDEGWIRGRGWDQNGWPGGAFPDN